MRQPIALVHTEEIFEQKISCLDVPWRPVARRRSSRFCCDALPSRTSRPSFSESLQILPGRIGCPTKRGNTAAKSASAFGENAGTTLQFVTSRTYGGEVRVREWAHAM